MAGATYPVVRPIVRAIVNSLAAPTTIGSGYSKIDFMGSALDPKVTFTRSTTKTYWGSAGTLQTAAINECPLEYDPNTLLPIGRSFWNSRTNLVLYSEGDLTRYGTNSGVSTAGTSITGFANSIAFGDNSVTRFAYTGATTSVTSGTTYAISAFVQMDDGLAPVLGSGAGQDLYLVVGGTVVTGATVKKLAGALYLVSGAVAAGSNAGNNGIAKATANTARTFRMTGLQIEANAYSGPYIPTNGATVTRAADVATALLSSFSANLISGPASIYANFMVPWISAGGVGVVSLDNSGRFIYTGAASPLFGIYDGTNIVQSTIISSGVFSKHMSTFGPAGLSITHDGTVPATGAFDGTMGAGGNTLLRIGHRDTPGVGIMDGWIQEIRIYNRQMTAAEQQSVTT